MRIDPLVGGETGDEEEEEGDAEEGGDEVHPDVHGQRRHEAEQFWGLLLVLLVEDSNAERHEGHGEVHCCLPFIGDGQVGHCYVRFLKGFGKIWKSYFLSWISKVNKTKSLPLL